MTWPVLFFLQIIIGALIGGMTNELAIRMLFRPYKAIYIKGWRVPFTPGLIPKRHHELAEQMGKLVENFLITPQGIRNMMQSSNIDKEVQNWLIHKINELAQSEETVSSLLEKVGITLSDEWEDQLRRELNQFLHGLVSRSAGMSMGELLPPRLKESLEEKVPDLAPFLLKKMAEYLKSDEGEETVRVMLSQLVGGLGGLFGGLAGMLLSDDKIIGKVSSSLEGALNNHALSDKLGEMLLKEFKNLYEKELSEIIQWIGNERVEEIVHLITNQLVKMDTLGQAKMKTLLNPIVPSLNRAVPTAVKSLLDWAQNNLEHFLKRINLTQIAANQVESFPVYRLEEMIVSITGKELRMITILGAVLGGMIGAFQGLLVLFLR